MYRGYGIRARSEMFARGRCGRHFLGGLFMYHTGYMITRTYSKRRRGVHDPFDSVRLLYSINAGVYDTTTLHCVWFHCCTSLFCVYTTFDWKLIYSYRTTQYVYVYHPAWNWRSTRHRGRSTTLGGLTHIRRPFTEIHPCILFYKQTAANAYLAAPFRNGFYFPGIWRQSPLPHRRDFQLCRTP